jgi:hypothetical protein
MQSCFDLRFIKRGSIPLLINDSSAHDHRRMIMLRYSFVDISVHIVPDFYSPAMSANR